MSNDEKKRSQITPKYIPLEGLPYYSILYTDRRFTQSAKKGRHKTVEYIDTFIAELPADVTPLDYYYILETKFIHLCYVKLVTEALATLDDMKQIGIPDGDGLESQIAKYLYYELEQIELALEYLDTDLRFARKMDKPVEYKLRYMRYIMSFRVLILAETAPDSQRLVHALDELCEISYAACYSNEPLTKAIRILLPLNRFPYTCVNIVYAIWHELMEEARFGLEANAHCIEELEWWLQNIPDRCELGNC